MSSTSSVQRPAIPSREDGSVTGIHIAFVPWVLFTLVTQRGSLLVAVVVALTAAVLISMWSLSKGHPRLLELAAVVAFAGFTVVAAVADPSTSAGVARYARAIAAVEHGAVPAPSTAQAVDPGHLVPGLGSHDRGTKRSSRSAMRVDTT